MYMSHKYNIPLFDNHESYFLNKSHPTDTNNALTLYNYSMSHVSCYFGLVYKFSKMLFDICINCVIVNTMFVSIEECIYDYTNNYWIIKTQHLEYYGAS